MFSARGLTNIIRRSEFITLRRYAEKVNIKALQDIGYDDLKTKLEKSEITLIDVRTEREIRENGFIPGSLNIPLDELGKSLMVSDSEFEQRYGVSKPSEDSPVATSCHLGIRATTAQLALLGAGYTDVRVYRGSFSDWTKMGGEVEHKS